MVRERPAVTADAGDIVLGWLTRLLVVLALGGVVLFDAVAVGVAHISAADDATSAATAAADTWAHTHDTQAAYDAAAQAIKDHSSAEVLTSGFSVAPDGTVDLQVRRKASTLALYRIGPLKRWTVVVSSGSARSDG